MCLWMYVQTYVCLLIFVSLCFWRAWHDGHLERCWSMSGYMHAHVCTSMSMYVCVVDIYVSTIALSWLSYYFGLILFLCFSTVYVIHCPLGRLVGVDLCRLQWSLVRGHPARPEWGRREFGHQCKYIHFWRIMRKYNSIYACMCMGVCMGVHMHVGMSM